LDRTLYHVAGFEEPGRVKAHAHASWSPGGDDGAGQQRDAGGQLRDDVGDAGDQQAGIGALAQLPVDLGGDRESRREGNLVGGGDAGSHGGEAVQTLAEVPLLVGGLEPPGGYVVDDSIAENILGYPLRRDLAGGLADDNSQLHLVVQLLYQAGVALDPAA